ncbi:cobalamin-binding protein [Streptomyces sp. SID13031]|uniref:cobalamin-binding protein n=1 Tax=Streptomyces sp. SID13031 TaxID=2706046 RepID=UPI00194205CA|nr:cobalamin-binding protein [Streptomyces sp. SID13031]
MRIVSLLPSATEICFALGGGDDVLGVTFECDYPIEARERRIVSTTNLPEGLTPVQIDTAVRERVAAGEDLYKLDRDALRDVAPDLVITQDLCAVCAIDLDDVEEALSYLGCEAQVVTTDPHDLDEVFDSIELIGDAIGQPAGRFVEDLRKRLAKVRIQGNTRVMLLEWTDPPFAPGHWIPEMIEYAGGVSVLGTAGLRSVRTTWPAIEAARPEVIVSAPCGFDLDAASDLTQELLDSGTLPPAVPVWAVDANGCFARPGPRLVDGVEALAGLLHNGPVDQSVARRLR